MTKRSNPTPAKRGDLFVMTCYSSATYINARTETTKCYELATVLSITRDGVVKRYRVVGAHCDSKSTPAEFKLIHSSQLKVEQATAAYVARHDWDRSFKTLDEAREFLQPFLMNTDGAIAT